MIEFNNVYFDKLKDRLQSQAPSKQTLKFNTERSRQVFIYHLECYQEICSELFEFPAAHLNRNTLVIGKILFDDTFLHENQRVIDYPEKDNYYQNRR